MTRTRTTPKNRTRGLGRASAAATICCAALALSSDGARAQQDPTVIGAGQKPYVMVIVDTSASMEFSQEGETRYACYDKTSGSACPVVLPGNTPPVEPRGGNDDTVFEWSPDGQLTKNGDPEALNNTSGTNPDSNVRQYVGPCRTWVPRCDQYERPPWLPEARASLVTQGSTRSYYNQQVDDMRGSRAADGTFTLPDSNRLKNYNQPRHVQVKELLTGDMVLRPNFSGTAPDDRVFSPDEYGPACFFVPRMFGARSNKDAYRVCHNERLIVPGDPTQGTILEKVPGTDFPDFVDHNDPRPHIQEVYDFQRRNGLLDNLSNVAIFSVAMFDGYQGRDPYTSGSGWEFDGTFVDGSAGERSTNGEASNRYNLGIYKVIGPSVALHEIETTSLAPLSTFAQMAIADSGFLTQGTDNAFRVAGDNSNTIGLSFPPSFDNLVQPYFLGQQPIAKGTPLAAAIHDVHMFFRFGQKRFTNTGGVSSNPGDVARPLGDDDFYQCRGKHVVMLTDGYPEPEAGTGIGSERLGPAYQYNEPDAYPYLLAEEEIADFVQYANNPAGTPIENPKFQTRVHIVGLNTERGVDPNTTSAKEAEVRTKMGLMAANGNTCAVYYLSKSEEGLAYIPDTLDIGDFSANPGTCDEGAGENCLVVQFTDKSSAPDYDTGEDTDDDGTTETIKCQSPALILSRNDENSLVNPQATDNREFRDDLAFALQIVFNEVIDATGGVASRTRAAVTNSIAIDGTRGQFRVYSGAEVGAGSIYWKGVLNREPYVCSATPPIEPRLCTDLDDPKSCIWPLHRDIALQVDQDANGMWTDNRRLFTSFPDLGNNPFSNPEIVDTGDDLFPTTYSLLSADNTASDSLAFDAFGETNLVNPANPQFLEGKRVGYRADVLRNVVGEVMSVPPNDVDNRLFGGSTEQDTQRVVDSVRGHLDEKRGQPFNAILNSNPSVVGPPTLDLPIASYRDFRDLYRNRATMLYVSTLDGILHAIHAGQQNGDLQVMVREKSMGKGDEAIDNVVPTNTDDDLSSATTSQREAWGYVPNMLRLDLFPNLDRQPNLLDGSPVVKDVRLCDANPDRNFNEQACGVITTNSGTGIPGAMQWRTVLVQGMGQSGAGYFAMDVTRSGGPLSDSTNGGTVITTDPDPVVLWEFDAEWERQQVESMNISLIAEIGNALGLPSGLTPDFCLPFLPAFDCNGSVSSFYEQSFLGISTGDPAIGTVVLENPNNSDDKFQRAVAVFGAGRVDGASSAARSGRALYIVDLQTGSLLRRFVGYRDETGAPRRFEYEVSGSPALFNDRVGSVTNRGFIGDAGGRLFRIDMSSSNPSSWSVSLMYDPCQSALKDEVDDINNTRDVPLPGNGCGVPSTSDYLDPPDRLVGPADFPPAVALDSTRRLVVTYGLGDRSDTTSAGKLQAVIAVVEEFETDPGTGELLFKPSITTERFAYPFENGEKLTGSPTIFNNGSYFTTYYTDPDDACAPGTSRIYGLDFNEQSGLFSSGSSPLVGKFSANDTNGVGGTNQFDNEGILKSPLSGSTNTYLWVGPKEPSLIRGLTIAFDVDCSGDPNGPAGSFSEDGDPPQPTLIAQIGGAEPPADIGAGNPGSSADGVARLEIKLDRGQSRAIPLSWGVVGF